LGFVALGFDFFIEVLEANIFCTILLFAAAIVWCFSPLYPFQILPELRYLVIIETVDNLLFQN